MRRATTAALTVVALVAGVVLATTLPASAAADITATSVELNASAGCADADLDIGMEVPGTVDTETGLTTNAVGETLGEFDQSTSFSGFSGVFDGYGQPVSPDQPEGTIIGSYASIGQAPLSAGTAAEWFVLYRCGSGGNIVLQTCFGDLGTCPSTAAEAVAGAFGAVLDPSAVVPGGTFDVDGEGCFDSLAGAVVLDGGTGIGVGDTVSPQPDGTFSISLTLPGDVTPGTTLTVQVDCGNEVVTVSSLDLPLEVLGDATPTSQDTSTTSSTTAPSAAAATEVAPAFTG